ncbi:hypothetical protein Q9L58_009778, partial [Maublancomyces gigas]
MSLPVPGVVPGVDLVDSDSFKNMITQYLREPRNAIGIRGPTVGGDRWEKWFHRVLEGRITFKYYRGCKQLRPDG